MTQTIVKPLTLYLGGKMLGRKGFGSEEFDEAAQALRALPYVEFVFNPAENDREHGFNPESLKGTQREMDAAGFSRHEALRQDFEWINRNSQGMIVLNTWKESDGAFGEMAYHQALKLPVWRLRDFIRSDGDEETLYIARMPSLRQLVISTGIFR